MGKPFQTEIAMVAMFASQVSRNRSEWAIYHETAGWDMLLVHRETGEQLGVEAKLTLNLKVIAQALRGTTRWHEKNGPDYRAILVPRSVGDGETLCLALGIGVIRVWPTMHTTPALPTGDVRCSIFPHWAPEKRHVLPDYVPDVIGGAPSPVRLSDWKIAAIKLQIVLERRGHVTRDDMRKLRLSQSRWTDKHHGFLSVRDGVFIRNDRTPDFRGQHPKSFAEIEADADQWLKFSGIDCEHTNVA